VPSQGERLDLYLVRNGHAASRRDARDLIAGGEVRVNGRRCRKGLSLTASDVVEVERSGGASAIVPNPDLPLRVLYQDDEMLVVDKPGLLPCHPLRAGETETLMNAVVARFPQAAEAGPKPLEGGLFHRLDNGTSGAVMVALTPAAFARLHAALRSKQIVRSYLAMVEGDVKRALRLDSPIAHHPRNQRILLLIGRGRRRRTGTPRRRDSEFPEMQKESPRRQRCKRGTTVKLITGQRKAGVGQMDADLMTVAGARQDFEQSEAARFANRCDHGQCRPCLELCCHPRIVNHDHLALVARMMCDG